MLRGGKSQRGVTKSYSAYMQEPRITEETSNDTFRVLNCLNLASSRKMHKFFSSF